MGVRVKTEKIIFLKLCIFPNAQKDSHYSNLVVTPLGPTCETSVCGEDRVRESLGLTCRCDNKCSDVRAG